MNDTLAGNDLVAVLAIAAGVLLCFWGYRILKVALAIAGFIAGATAGWQGAINALPGNNLVALVVAGIAGVLAAILCVWLFFLGIFLLGAGAGAAVAAALFGVADTQPQPVLMLVFAIVFGLIALLAQKPMIVLGTAIGGAHPITVGVMHFLTGAQNPFLWWQGAPPLGSAGYLGAVALLLWLVLAVLGAGSQFRTRVKQMEVEKVEANEARQGVARPQTREDTNFTNSH